MSIATAIKKHRKSRKMTQEGLATALGLKRVTIATYERGAVKPSLDVAYNMALLFNVSIESLLTDDNLTSREEMSRA